MNRRENARYCSVMALSRGDKEGLYGDININDAISALKLNPREAALASRLYYGVIQNRLYIDHCLARVSTRKLKELDSIVLAILRVGAYQLLFLDKIPPRAAVDEAVKLAKQTKNHAAAGFINAVLRQLSRKKSELLKIDENDEIKRLSIKYSHPPELVKLLRDFAVGQEIEALLRANNEIPPLTVRANTLKTSAAELMSALVEQGIEAEHLAFPDICLHLWGLGDVAQNEGYQKGLFSVQDAASTLSVLALELKQGDVVIDVCAAPGGKSLCAAELTADLAKIISCDISEKKLEQVKTEAVRLGIGSIETHHRDARVLNPSWLNSEGQGIADCVIADLPCSGFGVIRKKPDIRYKNLDETESLPALQLEILKTVKNYVKPGGVLLYSTCTLLRRENEDVVREFLKSGDFTLTDFFESADPKYRSVEGMLTLYPHIHGTDGFFICKMERK